jgi:hypothetical protein
MEAENGRRKGTFLVRDGCNARLAGGVRRGLGRGPMDFADYACEDACEDAASGVWTGIR